MATRCPSVRRLAAPITASLAASLAAVLLGACDQPALIDRTQPNAVRKADLLEGTWYIHEAVVDAPSTPGAPTFVGRGGRLEKVRWEIQEDLLVAYRSYEVVPGADPRVDREASRIGKVVFLDGRPYVGNPVFAYKIQSHFDRQRQYNPSTGEQSNVLVEDTQDRPWYQREYMRVDWKRNQLKNTQSDCASVSDTPSCLRGTGEFFRYVTNEDQAPLDEAMVFERDSSGKLVYFDWTTQAIMQPPTVYYRGYGRLPVCLFNPAVDCESGDVRVRTSVKRVDEAHVADYEPLVYGDKLMTKFGFFRKEAYTYSRDYAYTYSGRQFLAMRYDIWQRSHDDDGATIPIAQRALKPIVYHLSANTPAHLLPAASRSLARAAQSDPEATIEASWDHAFRRAVAVPRGLEPSEVPQMFYVCATPVKEGDPAACGAPGTYARLGDLRYNLVPYVQQVVGGLLGMGPSSMDPETGEVVQGVANIYGSTLDTWAAGSQQMMDVLNGEVSLSQLITGQDVKGYVLANLNPTDPRRPLSGPWSSQAPLTGDPTKPLGTFTAPQGRLKTLVDTWKGTGSPPLALEDRRATVQRLLAQSPALERELLELPEVRLAVRSLSAHPDFLAKIEADADFAKSVARDLVLGVDPLQDAVAQLSRAADPQVGCDYVVDYQDDDSLGVARAKLALQRQLVSQLKAGGSPRCAAVTTCTDAEALALAKAQVYDTIRREAYRQVSEHEIGHTLGLRHNFIASADALNYQDGYWALRKQTIGVLQGGRRVLPVTPRSLQDAAKPNQHQLDERLSEYRYSSIMDYGGRVTSQNRGIGKYDEAAILFAYAGGAEPGWVEVFNRLRTDYRTPNLTVPVDNQAKTFTVRGAHVEIPLAQVEHYTPVSTFYGDKYHYTTLPLHFADPQGTLEAMLDQGIERLQSRSFRKWSELVPHYQRLATALDAYTLSQTGLYESDFERARDIVVAAGGAEIPVEVPYLFCTDGDVGANLLCNPNDEGADVFEMTSKWIERFNETYVFANFRRDKLSFSPVSAAAAKYNRYIGHLPNVYHQWLFNIFSLANNDKLTAEQLDQYYGLGDPIFQGYWTMAVVDSTNLLLQQLAVPSVGYHGKRADGVWEYVPSSDPTNRQLESAAEARLVEGLTTGPGAYTEVLYLPRGPGRSMFSVYDSTGYDHFNRVDEAGHFWDTYGALLALTTSETTFLGVDRGSDALRYSLPYYLTFNRELGPLFADFWAGNSASFAASLGRGQGGAVQVRLPTFLNAKDYVAGFDYPVIDPPLDSAGQVVPLAKVLPVTSWSARFYAEVMSMGHFTTNFDLEFANLNQVFRLGSADSLTPAAGFEVVSVVDPFGGGFSYAAFRALPGPTSAAAAMVLRASDFNAKWQTARGTGLPVDGLDAAEWEAKVRDTIRSLELMRGLYDIFGRTW